MSYLSHIGIVANVRPDGSMGEYNTRTFDLMLCSLEDQAKQIKEAKRILRQIGYQVKSAQFEPVPDN